MSKQLIQIKKLMNKSDRQKLLTSLAVIATRIPQLKHARWNVVVVVVTRLQSWCGVWLNEFWGKK